MCRKLSSLTCHFGSRSSSPRAPVKFRARLRPPLATEARQGLLGIVMSSEEEPVRIDRASEEETHHAAAHASRGEHAAAEAELPDSGEIGDAAFTMPDEATPSPIARHVLGGEPTPPGLASAQVPNTLAPGGVPPGPVVAPITPMRPAGAATTEGSPAKKKGTAQFGREQPRRARVCSGVQHRCSARRG